MSWSAARTGMCAERCSVYALADTATGEARSYFNLLGHAAAAVTDTNAFDTCE